MKARLIRSDDTYQLLLCTGKIMIVTKAEGRDFLMNFNNPEYYAGDTKWDYENLTMEDYSGETIAIVNDNDTLTVFNSLLFREIMTQEPINYLTVSEYADIHGKKVAIVRRLCSQNRIAGVILKGNTWLIPEGSPYPSDERFRN